LKKLGKKFIKWKICATWYTLFVPINFELASQSSLFEIGWPVRVFSPNFITRLQYTHKWSLNNKQIIFKFKIFYYVSYLPLISLNFYYVHNSCTL
jgi:hypothetical protein